MMFISWLLGLICFAAVIGIVVFPILAIISGIKEAKRPKEVGQKKHSKAMLYINLTLVSFFALILCLVGYGVVSYAFSVASDYM